jgi:hypothetical protein
VCHQISLAFAVIHLIHRVLLEPPIDMSLYKDMSCLLCIFTHTLSIPSCTTLVNMPHYLIPVWNKCPFCGCGQRAKLTTSLEMSTYGRICWVCPNTNRSGAICFSISISYIDQFNYSTTANIDGVISAFLVRLI